MHAKNKLGMPIGDDINHKKMSSMVFQILTILK